MTSDKNTYCVIMAGGVGSRLWPMSQGSKPKQFMDILGVGETLLQQSFRRFSNILPAEKLFVITLERYIPLVREQLPQLAIENIIGEPERKDTATCIAYATTKIQSIDANARLIFAPSDHLVLKETEFEKTICSCIDFVRDNDLLLTIGIKPNYAETGYGYIQISQATDAVFGDNFFKTKTFTEKPSADVARILVDSGEFFWNSGIFIWSASAIQTAFMLHSPELYELFQIPLDILNSSNEAGYIKSIYQQCKSISIDYAIMEHAENVAVKIADFGWSDLGSWESINEHTYPDENGNVLLNKDICSISNSNCILAIPDNKIALIEGLDNYIVALSDNALMICRRSDSDRLKDFIKDAKGKYGKDFMK